MKLASIAARKPTWPRCWRRTPPGEAANGLPADLWRLRLSPKKYDIERKFRETRLYQVAPISTNLILSHLAEHVLGMPRSY